METAGFRSFAMKNHLASLLFILSLSMTNAAQAETSFFSVPLAAQASGPIDPELLGIWRMVSEKGLENAYASISRYSDQEYIIACVERDSLILTARAYPIEVNGQKYLQVELLDNKNNPMADLPFMVLKLELGQKKLFVSRLALIASVPNALDSTSKLQAAIEEQSATGTVIEPVCMFVRNPY
jgi:hypothetical protein